MLHWRISASLPTLDGTLQVDGLSAEVEIARDAAGVPTITGQSREDTAYGLGFVHAQERFFQMDMLRRVSSGRLSELIGSATIAVDQSFRRHRFASIARSTVAEMTPAHRSMFEAYARGVNEGLNQLGAAPFEYTLLRAEPATWTAEDSIHVMQTMLTDLQSKDGMEEVHLGKLHQQLPSEVFEFMLRTGSQWDAALDDSTIEPPPLPGSEIWSLRELLKNPQTALLQRHGNDKEQHVASKYQHPWSLLANPTSQFAEQNLVGSNNWAVGGDLSASGSAILASDMHLGLRVPAIWYRACLKTPCLDGKVRRLVGVTLPGLPGLIEGSNGSVAWGLTNSHGDFGDIVELVPGPKTEAGLETYVTPDGPRELKRVSEVIRVGGTEQEFEFEWTIWGPVIHQEEDKRFVHRWVGNDPTTQNSRLFDLESAEDTNAALAIGAQAGPPHLNLVVADSAGDVGWTLSGPIPSRSDIRPPRTPQDWSEGGAWQGYLPKEEQPLVKLGSDGRVWTANNRIVGGAAMNRIGDFAFDHGGRAHQVRARLFEKDAFDESDMLAIQRDHEARFLTRWQELLVSVLGIDEEFSEDFVNYSTNWDATASAGSVGYRVVRSFRLNVHAIMFGQGSGERDVAIEQRGAFFRAAGFEGAYVRLNFEDALWDLLEERPMHWLPPEFESWNALLVEAAKSTQRVLTQDGPLSDATWGSRNQSRIQHPLSNSLPLLSRWLDMPKLPLSGDSHMPLVQSPAFGASQRMVVSPGHEEQGIYHQPGGQSGHPYSPHYRTGFSDWAAGKASPLLPGDTRYTLTLTPLP